jgi:PAS domain S-box-containing protein
MNAGYQPPSAAIEHPRAASLLHAALEATTDGIHVVDAQGRSQTANARFRDIWRLSPEEIAVPPEQRLRLMGERLRDPEKLTRAIEDLGDHPERETFDILELRDGRILERYSRPQVVDGRIEGRVWTYRDVTERRRAEELLRESEERFRLIAENVGDLVAMLDTEGRRLYTSPSYRTLFAEDDTRVGTDSFLEIHPADREHIRNIFQETVRSGQGQATEFRFLLKDGSVRHIESEGRVIRDGDGRVAKVVVVSRDITERKRADQRAKMEHGVTRVLADSETLAQAMPNILRVVCETLEWNCGVRWVMDESNKSIRCAETWTASAGLDGFANALKAASFETANPGSLRRVWLTREPLWCCDQEADATLSELEFQQ